MAGRSDRFVLACEVARQINFSVPAKVRNWRKAEISNWRTNQKVEQLFGIML